MSHKVENDIPVNAADLDDVLIVIIDDIWKLVFTPRNHASSNSVQVMAMY